MFDPDSFMSTSVEGESATVYEPIPVGEYTALIEKVEPKVTPNGNALLEVTFKLDAPENELADQKTCRYAVWLDTTDNGGLDMGKGKNVALGRLRAAVNQNGPGAWNPAALAGNVARILVVHNPDKEDASIIYANVKAVTAV